MPRLRFPILANPAEVIPAVRIAVKIIAGQTTFPNANNPNHVKARRGELAESLAATELSQRYGMITNGAHIGRKELPWEIRMSQLITVGISGPEIDQVADGRTGSLPVEVKSRGGASEKIKGSAGLILMDHLAGLENRDKLTGLIYADTRPEPFLRYTCIRALYEILGGAPPLAQGLDQSLIGGSIPANTGVTDEVRKAFYKYSGSKVGSVKAGFERQLRELQNRREKVLTGDETLKLLEPLQEMFGIQELITLELPKLGDTIATEQTLGKQLGKHMDEAHEIVLESQKSAGAKPKPISDINNSARATTDSSPAASSVATTGEAASAASSRK